MKHRYYSTYDKNGIDYKLWTLCSAISDFVAYMYMFLCIEFHNDCRRWLDCSHRLLVVEFAGINILMTGYRNTQMFLRLLSCITRNTPQLMLRDIKVKFYFDIFLILLIFFIEVCGTLFSMSYVLFAVVVVFVILS